MKLYRKYSDINELHLHSFSSMNSSISKTRVIMSIRAAKIWKDTREFS